MRWRNLTRKEIWHDIMHWNEPESEWVFIQKLIAFPLLFIFFLFAWWGDVGEEEEKIKEV